MVAGLALAACGGTEAAKPAQPADRKPAVPQLRQRQDAACQAAGTRITDCAVADALATMTPAELAREHMVGDDLEWKKSENTKHFVEACTKAELSSRQVRVYEVCMHEASACDPYLDCLEHVNDKATPAASPQP